MLTSMDNEGDRLTAAPTRPVSRGLPQALCDPFRVERELLRLSWGRFATARLFSWTPPASGAPYVGGCGWTGERGMGDIHPRPLLQWKGVSIALVALVAAVAVGGCGKPSSGTTAPATVKSAPADPRLFTCLDPAEQTPALLWNGQVGTRIGRDGRGVGPLLMTDEFETAGEEKIISLFNPVG